MQILIAYIFFLQLMVVGLSGQILESAASLVAVAHEPETGVALTLLLLMVARTATEKQENYDLVFEDIALVSRELWYNFTQFYVVFFQGIVPGCHGLGGAIVQLVVVVESKFAPEIQFLKHLVVNDAMDPLHNKLNATPILVQVSKEI